MDRRQFLRGAGALGVAGGLGLWLPGRGALASPRTLRLRGGSTVAPAAPEGSTLASSIIRADGSGYVRLLDGPAWPTVVRAELAEAASSRADERVALASFVHLTDVHLIDAQSTGRVEFLDPEGEPFTAAFRPQETLTLQVFSSMIDRINEVGVGPVTGRPFDCAVSTGDNIDSMQWNEAAWFVGALDGGSLAANSGDPDRYEGVQLAGFTADLDTTYWHPAEGERDRWKDELGYPDYPGLLDAAVAPFESAGLDIPWYSTYGNHDGLVQGVIPTTEAVEAVLVERFKMTGLPAGIPGAQFVVGVAASAPDAIIAQLASGEYPNREVTPDPDRRTLSAREWVQLHLDSTATPGPSGHGYTEDHLELPELYYRFALAPGVVGLSMDTGGYYSGSIGESQLVWLEEQLVAASSRYYDDAGTEVSTGNEDQLVLVFSHFNPSSMNSVIPNPDRPDERRIQGEELVAFFHRFPNLIAWVNGHHHVNAITAMPDPSGRTAGFWDINTASHVDHPQQSRVIEVAANGDGTLSIFCTMLEHLAPAATDPDDLSPRGLASISRELAANDPQSGLDARSGRDLDRNVELVLAAPFDLRSAGLLEAATTTSDPGATTASSAPAGAGNGGGAAGDPDEGGEDGWRTLVAGGVIGLATVGVAGAVAGRRRRAAASVSDGEPGEPDLS